MLKSFLLLPLIAQVLAAQIPFGTTFGTKSDAGMVDLASNVEQGTGHLSDWSRTTKNAFLDALRANDANDWIIVLGNEAGDTDSMVSALAYAYHLTHLEKPLKAVALLQTSADALELRPENLLALQESKMASEHKDLLTFDELIIKPIELGHRIKGLALVDHNIPRSYWNTSKVLAIIDHHEDGQLFPEASPRVIEMSASCTSLVSRLILDYEEKRRPTVDTLDDFHGPFPRELVDLLLRAIALDSDGLKNLKKGNVDRHIANRLLPRSSWKGKNLMKVMDQLDGEMGTAKRDLSGLSLRDLLRRDWKGDDIETKSERYPTIALGFASTSVSMDDQIKRTPEATAPEWFAIERAFTAESGVDVSIALNSFRDAQGVKTREIALVVAHGLGKRLHEGAADSLFNTIKLALETSPLLDLKVWNRPDRKILLPRRAVWSHQGKAGRKQIRPLVEEAVRNWDPVRSHRAEL